MKDEGRAFPRITFYFDGTLMRFDKRLDQAQTEAQAALRTALVAAIKTAPDFVLFLLWDSHAVVAEEHQGFLRRAASLDLHCSPWRCVFEGVIEQVCKDLAHARWIHAGFAWFEQVRVDSNSLFFSHLGIKIHDFPDKRSQ